MLWLKVFLQAITTAAAYATVTLNYKWKDGRTTTHKVIRKGLYALTILLLVTSVTILVHDESSRELEKASLNKRLDRVTTQNADLILQQEKQFNELTEIWRLDAVLELRGVKETSPYFPGSTNRCQRFASDSFFALHLLAAVGSDLGPGLIRVRISANPGLSIYLVADPMKRPCRLDVSVVSQQGKKASTFHYLLDDGSHTMTFEGKALPLDTFDKEEDATEYALLVHPTLFLALRFDPDDLAAVWAGRSRVNVRSMQRDPAVQQIDVFFPAAKTKLVHRESANLLLADVPESTLESVRKKLPPEMALVVTPNCNEELATTYGFALARAPHLSSEGVSFEYNLDSRVCASSRPCR